AHGRLVRARARHARAVAVDRPRPALSVDQPHRGTARRVDRPHRAARPLRPRATTPSPRPPSRARVVAAQPARRRCLRRPPSLPVRARRPARRDLPAPSRVRARPHRRVLARACAVDHRTRTRRRPRQARVLEPQHRRASRPRSARGLRARHPRRRRRHDGARAAEGDGVNWRRLSLFGGAVGALHAAGWGLLVYYAGTNPALIGLGTLAYTFGLRHAFDADHIAAIDNTTRKFLQDGRRSYGVGFFFSLGHSSVVFALAAGLGFATSSVRQRIPSFQHWGGPVGTGVSGAFLLAIGVLNLLVLMDVVGIFREMRRGGLDEDRLEARLLDRGLMSRGVLKRLG